MSNEIKFIVLGDVKDLEKKLSGTKKAFDQVAKVSALAFTAMTASAYGFIEAARTQEAAVNQLNQSLKNQGKYSDETSKDLQNYAAALQKVSLYGDETIIQAEAIIASFGFEGDILKSLTKATLDLAQAKGMNLVAAADLVSKSVGSTTNALTRYGIQVDGVAGSNERARSAIENINRLFSGQAEAATKGLGATVVLKNAIGDLSEQIGFALAPKITELTIKIQKLVDYMNQNPAIAKMAADFLVLGIQVAAGVTAFALIGSAIISVTKTYKGLDEILMTASKSSLSLKAALGSVAAIGAAAFIGWKVGELVSEITGLNDAVKKLGTYLGEIQAKKSLGSDYISEEEFNLARKGWMERKALLDEENAAREQQQQDIIAKRNELTNFFTANAQQLTAISATQTQAELDDLILKLEQERQAKIDDLMLRQQMLDDAGVLEVTKRQEIQDQIKAINDQYNALELAAEQQQQNKINSIERKGAEISRQINEDKIGSLKSSLLQAAQLNSKFANAYKAVAIGEAIMSTQAGMARALKDYSWPWNLVVAALVGAAGAVNIATIASQSFAVGTAEVPEDMVANIHKKEMIVTAPIAESIRAGDLSLSGPGGGSGGITFDFSNATFNGITESFVRDIFTKASEAINSRTLAPLPAV